MQSNSFSTDENRIPQKRAHIQQPYQSTMVCLLPRIFLAHLFLALNRVRLYLSNTYYKLTGRWPVRGVLDAYLVETQGLVRKLEDAAATARAIEAAGRRIDSIQSELLRAAALVCERKKGEKVAGGSAKKELPGGLSRLPMPEPARKALEASSKGNSGMVNLRKQPKVCELTNKNSRVPNKTTKINQNRPPGCLQYQHP